MKVYLAGPMQGMIDHAYPLFEAAELTLKDQGLEVYSPHRVDHGENEQTRGTTKSHGEYLASDVSLLLSCDAIVLLPGWATSKGAMIELNLAIGCGMPVYLYDPDKGIASHPMTRGK